MVVILVLIAAPSAVDAAETLVLAKAVDFSPLGVPVTLPVATSNAANSEVVPWRTQSCVPRSAWPGVSRIPCGKNSCK